MTPNANAKAVLKALVLLPLALKAISSNVTDLKLPKLQPADWPHRPVYVQAGSDTEAIGIGRGPVPLGVPFEIDSPLFRGRVLLRFRSAGSDDPGAHAAYFRGRKRRMQTVLQGRFKRPVKMSEVYAGTLFARPLAGPPPSYLSSVMDAILRRVAPGLVLDLNSDLPKVIALMAGTAQTMSIDEPGQEPDIGARDIKENVAGDLGGKVGTKSKRLKRLGNPAKAAAYEFNTEKVYTFQIYDDAMDYGRGTMHIPFYGDYDIKPYIGKQPLSLTAVTSGGEILYDLRVWHESIHYDPSNSQ